jgi:alpha-glucosidase
MNENDLMKKLLILRQTLPYILSVVLLLISAGANTQTVDVGSLKNWKKTQTGIEGTTENATFRVTVYNENVIRITISRENKISDFSYVLDENATPVKTDYTINEKENLIIIRSSFIQMEIEKTPVFRVIFRNKQGLVINEDVPGRGFCTGFAGSRSTIYKKLQPGERFIGLGEVLGNLDKRGSGYTLNNTDTYKYGDPRLSMYVSIPFYMGIHQNQVYGVFSHNTYRSFFNFALSTPDYSSITLEGGNVDYFLIYDTDVAGILENYTWLTGRMPLPPLWSLGYHQSRCSYFPQSNVEILAETFRKKKLPVDCIVLDADYLYHYQPFRINTERFPDMPGLTGKLKQMGIEVTASVNPGIMIDSTYDAYKDGLAKDIFLKYFDGSLYTADIAPNTNNYPDFSNPKSREWWTDKMKFLPDNGIHSYWNDMNEPAVGGSYIPDNLLFDFDGHKANALEAKNLFGMLMARSSFEAALKNGGDRRPFILTRSGFAGVQRYAAIWTGDNTAKDEYLLGGTLLNCQMGLSGIPFVGDDIGGYIGPTSKELFTRWMQVGMFQPFARNHKEAYAAANEPWSYGEEAEAISREFMEFRYRLLPYLYSKFYEATQTGMPITRSLAIDNPFDNNIYNSPYQYQFLCGDAIMVVPVTSQEKIKSIYLPEGEWYDLYSDKLVVGNFEFKEEVPDHRIPLYVKASSIIPMQSAIQTTKEKPVDTLYLHVYNGRERNTFVYYEDDGYTNAYKQGLYYRRLIELDPQERKLFFRAPEGKYPTHFKTIKCILHGFNDEEAHFSINGKPHHPKSETVRMIDALRYLDDLYIPEYYEGIRTAEQRGVQFTFNVDNTDKEIVINW